MRAFTLALAFFLTPAARADAPDPAVKAAVQRGLKRIEQGAANYPKNRQCFSCHHQAMSILSMTSARWRGFEVEEKRVKEQLDFSLKSHSNKDQIAKGTKVAGGNTQVVYILLTLKAADHKADETTKALVNYLLLRQNPDGSWRALAKRPPSEGSSFTNTALALFALKEYGPARDDKDADELRTRIDKADKKGSDWLRKNKPATMEDRVFHLRGLVYAGAEKKEIEAAREQLLKEQNADGSWSQLPDLKGDAYATGAAVLALRVAGLKTSDE